MSRFTFFCLIACLISAGGILYGYDIGVISGALLFIEESIPMQPMQIGVVVSAMLYGSLLGSLAAGPLGDDYGRRPLILLASGIVMCGVIGTLLAHTFYALFFARILLGCGVGMVTVAVPLYVAEMVPARHRGKYMTLFQLMLTFGILLAYFVDLLFTPSHQWRAMFAVVLIPAGMLMLSTWLLPESPRWLLSANQVAKAAAVLARLTTASATMANELAEQPRLPANGSSRWRELCHVTSRQPLLIGVLVAIFNQLTGINAFLQYAPLILKHAGLQSNVIVMIASVGIGSVNLACTMLALTFIDSLGRRPLMLWGVAIIVCAEMFLAITLHLHGDSTYFGWFVLLGLLGFIVGFAIGPGVVGWLIITELFPTRIRSKGTAICLFFNSMTAAVLATFFLPLMHHLGFAGMFAIFTAISMTYFIFCFCLLPETKTKSLEEIQWQLRRASS